jgi:hypothetical protein
LAACTLMQKAKFDRLEATVTQSKVFFDTNRRLVNSYRRFGNHLPTYTAPVPEDFNLNKHSERVWFEFWLWYNRGVYLSIVYLASAAPHVIFLLLILILRLCPSLGHGLPIADFSRELSSYETILPPRPTPNKKSQLRFIACRSGRGTCLDSPAIAACDWRDWEKPRKLYMRITIVRTGVEPQPSQIRHGNNNNNKNKNNLLRRSGEYVRQRRFSAVARRTPS